jgi:hypothetical protein
MTYEPTSTTTSPGRPGDASGGGVSEKTEAAKDVASKAANRAGDVAGEVTEQAKIVARDAKDHARQLFDQGRRHLDDEARARSQQAAGGLRGIADQLGALAVGDQQGAGAVGDYARQARDQISRLADRLDDGPAAVLDDVRRFARRQPAVFLAAAGALGFVAGRLVRGARDAAPSSNGTVSPALGSERLPGELPAPGVIEVTPTVVAGAPTVAPGAPTVVARPVGDIVP